MDNGKNYVRFTESPDSKRIPIDRTTSLRPFREHEVYREEVSILPERWEEPQSRRTLEEWADHFAPSISRMLPSSGHTFVPLSLSVEQEQFVRDEFPQGEDDLSTTTPRRVRVTRRRVTLFGTFSPARS
jgi:hypothetical protein